MDFALIETLRWDPADGFVRGDLHLDRMEASAAELGFAFNRRAVLKKLEAAVYPPAPLRVRAELAQSGRVDVTVARHTPQAEDALWNLGIADKARIDSADPLIRHKTTRRDVYNAARKEFAASVADDVLVLNERGEICDGTITNLFVRMLPGEPLMTPRLSSGLLPGVLRRELLESGLAVEAILLPERLGGAHEIFAGNSLRGLIRARMA